MVENCLLCHLIVAEEEGILPNWVSQQPRVGFSKNITHEIWWCQHDRKTNIQPHSLTSTQSLSLSDAPWRGERKCRKSKADTGKKCMPNFQIPKVNRRQILSGPIYREHPQEIFLVGGWWFAWHCFKRRSESSHIKTLLRYGTIWVIDQRPVEDACCGHHIILVIAVWNRLNSMVMWSQKDTRIRTKCPSPIAAK